MNPTPEFMEAIKRHRRLVDTLGMDHPDTLRAMMLSANLHRRHLSVAQAAAIVASAQDWAKAQSHGGNRRADQVDSSPLETIADRAAMGLSNDGIVTDARLVHRKQ